MQVMSNEIRLTARLVDSLYVEAMVLADEVRAYFDEHGRVEREALPPLLRVAFSCESLKVTTRLMHVIAWLLTRRAVEHGEISPAQAQSSSRRLGLVAESDPEALAALPDMARVLVDASRDLYARVERLDQDIDRPTVPVPSPARGLLSRLERAF
jgi:regulator of CtrA degradation